MVPGEPCQAGPIGTETWGRVEVITRDQHLAIAPCKIEAHQGVDCFAPGNAVIFAPPNGTVAAAVKHAIGIAQVCSGREGLRCGISGLTVEALVSKVGKTDCPVTDNEGATAILVDA